METDNRKYLSTKQEIYADGISVLFEATIQNLGPYYAMVSALAAFFKFSQLKNNKKFVSLAQEMMMTLLPYREEFIESEELTPQDQNTQ